LSPERSGAPFASAADVRAALEAIRTGGATESDGARHHGQWPLLATAAAIIAVIWAVGVYVGGLRDRPSQSAAISPAVNRRAALREPDG
jgi:hypothetical protein